MKLFETFQKLSLYYRAFSTEAYFFRLQNLKLHNYASDNENCNNIFNISIFVLACVFICYFWMKDKKK